MKKFITFLLASGMVLIMQAQDISGSLGANGNFIIEDDSQIQLLKVQSTGSLFIGKGSAGFTNARTLNVLNQNSSAGISLSSYKGGGFSARSRIDFHTNQGSVGSPATATSGDPIGWLLFNGYDGTDWNQGANIEVQVDGTVSSSHVPMSIDFKTDDGSNLSTRLLIKSDGTINVPGLSGTGDGYVKVDANGNLFRSATKAPSSPGIQQEILQLKKENEDLKNEVKQLKEMVLKLMEK